MLFTKGVILGKSQTDSNKYSVRVPILESAGNSQELVSKSDAVLEASLCYAPGNTDGYRVGDVVFLTFEDNVYDKAVIIGKLYLGEEEEATSHQNINTLTVNGTTTINGKVKVNGLDLSNINKNKQAIDDLFGQTSDINKKLANVQEGSFGSWIIKPNHNDIVLNFYRATLLK